MSRTVPEWIATHDDQKVPDAVRLRIFRTHDGICYLSGAKIQTGQAWQLEHVIPLSSVPGKVSGLHRESNLRPALVGPHKVKTKEEAKARAKADRVAKRNLGIVPTPTIQSRGFGGSMGKEAKREERRQEYASTQRRPMFVDLPTPPKPIVKVKTAKAKLGKKAA